MRHKLVIATSIYLSLLYIWLSWRALGQLNDMLAELGGAQPWILRAVLSAALFMQENTLLSWAGLNLVFVVIFFLASLVLNFEKLTYRGVRATSAIALLSAVLVSAVVRSVPYQGLFSIITEIE